MKLTNKQLRQIIKEEIEAVMDESYGGIQRHGHAKDDHDSMRKTLEQSLGLSPDGGQHSKGEPPGTYDYNNGIAAIATGDATYTYELRKHAVGYSDFVAAAEQAGFQEGSIWIDSSNPQNVSNTLPRDGKFSKWDGLYEKKT